MTNGPTTEDTTPAPPPPPGDPTARIPLRRSSSDRVVAGVSGGIARYFGIDAVIVRLAFVVITLFGGSGILLYLIAWVAIPREDQDESAAMNALRGGHRPGGRALLAVGLLFGAIVLLSGSLVLWPIFGFGHGLALPLLILAAGVALIVWPSSGAEWHRNWHEERSAVRDEFRRERDEWRKGRREWRHGYRRGFAGDAGSDEPSAAQAGSESESGYPTAPPLPPLPPWPTRVRPKPFLGPLTVALLLLFTGATVFAERVGWVTVDPGVFLAICLILVGLVLVVSAFMGRARGLIWLGALLLPIAWMVSAVDLTWWHGIGEERIQVTSAGQLEDTYRWGIGEFTVDLSDLDLNGQEQDLAVGLTIGELTVYVPEGIEVDIDLDARIGEAIIRDGDLNLIDDGLDLSLDRTTGDSAGGILHLDVDLGIGEVEVIVCGSTGGGRCP